MAESGKTMEALIASLRQERERLQQGGGPDRLAKQQESLGGVPERVGEHGVNQIPGAFLLVLHLEGAAIRERPTENPALVGIDEKTLHENLSEAFEVGLRPREMLRFDLREHAVDQRRQFVGVTGVPGASDGGAADLASGGRGGRKGSGERKRRL